MEKFETTELIEQFSKILTTDLAIHRTLVTYITRCTLLTYVINLVSYILIFLSL